MSEIDDANISKYKYFCDRYSGRNAVKQSINNMVNENITSLLEQEAEAVRNIPVTPGYEEAVSLIVKHVHDLGGKLIMSGMGKACLLYTSPSTRARQKSRMPSSA